MLSKLQKIKSQKSDSNKGFTIIEVMIVLAIAGLILLIVFLAVPALQRSSRNTQRKNDAAAIGGAIANYISNNNGTLPTLVSGDGKTDTNILQVEAATTGNSEAAKLGYYTLTASTAQSAASGQDGSVYISKAAATAVAPTVAAVGLESATKVSTNTVAIIYGQDCTPTANARTAAIYYVTESGSGNGSLQCVEQ